MTSSLKLFSVYFNSSLHKTNRFQVAMHLFSNRSQRMSKYGKNISETFGCASCATFLFLPHFDVICGLLPNRCTETWNLFVEHILHTVLYTFPKVLTRRICLTILSYPYLLTLSFILVTLMFDLGVINKLDASLSLRSKGWRKFRRKFSIFLLW